MNNKNIKYIYKKYQYKNKKTKLLWTTLNIISILITSFIGVINLFGIKYNNDKNTIWIFITITILSLTIAFVNSIYLFFNIKNKINKIDVKINKIKEIEKKELSKEEKIIESEKVYLFDK